MILEGLEEVGGDPKMVIKLMFKVITLCLDEKCHLNALESLLKQVQDRSALSEEFDILFNDPILD